MKDMVGGCCVCSDERGWPENPLVYCDGNGCTVAVHQACYGIVTVPTGPWYCRKCESSDRLGRARCELCPSRSGALKRVATGGWAHVVCALYIPEVRFGNVTSMEPIILELIPQERFNKTCYICQEAGKVHRAVAGACMQCNKSGCKQQFHVTCAQGLGLLCEEAGNYLDNVKYCGYCQHHYGKLKKGGNVKTIPPYKPSHDSQSSDSSGEREGDASPAPGGSATPTHTNRNRPATGRKTSHSASSATARATPSTSKTPTQTAQSFGGKHSAEKSTKKVSPPAESSRRSSVASDTSPAPTTSAGSKPTTPVPSPQRTTPVAAQDPPIPTTKGSRSVGGGTPTSSPGTSTKPVEPHSVISSVSATSTVTSSSSVATVSLAQPVSTASQVPQKPAPVYQESVITNTDVSGEYKHTKKRKAASQSTTPTPAPEYPATPPPPNSLALMKKTATRKPGVWGEGPEAADATVADKVKKAKIDSGSMEGVTYGHLPPPQSPTSHGMPSPRHQVSPVIQTRTNPGRNIRCPQTQGGRPAAAASGEAGSASLLVSVPLPPASQGLNLSAQTQVAAAAASEGPAPTALSFYQLQKQVTEQAGSVRTHSPQPSTSRAAWGGLQVSYEMQQPADKSLGGGAGANTSTIRSNKKRAAMNTSVVAHSNTAVSALQSTSGQPASASKQQNTPPLPPPPPPSMPPPQPYVLLDSPPGSPVFEKTVRTKVERSIVSGIAHHMLGNELNPDSSSAARLSEQLNAELAAHSVGLQPPSPSSVLYPPPLINRATSGSGRSTTAGGGAQSLDQLLERQWDQGGQLIMEQAQHFDKNVRLEDHVANLERRRDHLLAVNARLANSLAAGTPQPEGSRCPRENGSQVRPPGVVRGDSQSADGSEQIMMRELQQKPS